MPTNKPMPVQTAISAPFWDSLRDNRLTIQHCTDCGAWIFYPRRHCNRCWSPSVEWRTVPGTGTLHSFTVSRLPTLPEFADEMPQMLAVVQLDEGVRINTTLYGLAEEEIRVGMPVRPVFDARIPEAVLLRFTGADKTAVPARLEPDDAPLETSAPPAADLPPEREVRVDDEAALASLVSEEFSPWSNQIVVDQALIDEFARLSGDDYWIHTDPEKARKQGPFGGTIAHGALVQVLMSRLTLPMGFRMTGYTNMVNYGSDRLRFPTPVPAGSRIHARCRVKAAERSKRGTQLTIEFNIHVVGNDRPAVINDLVILYM